MRTNVGSQRDQRAPRTFTHFTSLSPEHGLQDIYYAENQIVKSLPDMIENASDAELKRGLREHLRETEGQVKRLEQVFALHGQRPSGTKCPAIDGIIKEGGDLMLCFNSRTGCASGSCPRVRGWSTARRPGTRPIPRPGAHT